MFVASGRLVRAATAAMPGMPGVGSSRYSSTPSSSPATWWLVCTVQFALGSSRSGWSGNAARSARIAAISSSGGQTPPLSLSEPNP